MKSPLVFIKLLETIAGDNDEQERARDAEGFLLYIDIERDYRTENESK